MNVKNKYMTYALYQANKDTYISSIKDYKFKIWKQLNPIQYF